MVRRSGIRCESFWEWLAFRRRSAHCLLIFDESILRGTILRILWFFVVLGYSNYFPFIVVTTTTKSFDDVDLFCETWWFGNLNWKAESNESIDMSRPSSFSNTEQVYHIFQNSNALLSLFTNEHEFAPDTDSRHCIG